MSAQNGTHGRMGQDCPIGQQGQQPAGTATEATERTRAACRLSDTKHDERRPDESQWSQEGRAVDGRHSPWDDYELIPCGDGKVRRLKPGLEPLAARVPGRVAQLRGLGNAIVPQLAAVFIRALMDVIALEESCSSTGKGSNRTKL